MSNAETRAAEREQRAADLDHKRQTQPGLANFFVWLEILKELDRLNDNLEILSNKATALAKQFVDIENRENPVP